MRVKTYSELLAIAHQQWAAGAHRRYEYYRDAQDPRSLDAARARAHHAAMQMDFRGLVRYSATRGTIEEIHATAPEVQSRDEQERCSNCYGTDPERCVVCLRRQRDDAVAERDALRQQLATADADMQACYRRHGEVLSLAEERLAWAHQLQADIEAKQQGRLETGFVISEAP